ncbi:MAG: hypothetical protein JWP87_1422 [Labilithrix sp.]|nr:hypothetical protein [Labilithrix sp.]
MMCRKNSALVAIALGVAACASCAVVPDPNQAAVVSPPSREQFIMGGVNDFMERRCGALDCHGQIGRPLRIYGALGLRKTDPSMPGAERPTTATTDDEKIDNYLSAIDLEPEAIGYANATKGEYDDFLLLKKPLGLENEGVRHKGGPVLRVTGDPGFECLRSWIRGAVRTKDCQDATF